MVLLDTNKLCMLPGNYRKCSTKSNYRKESISFAHEAYRAGAALGLSKCRPATIFPARSPFFAAAQGLGTLSNPPIEDKGVKSNCLGISFTCCNAETCIMTCNLANQGNMGFRNCRPSGPAFSATFRICPFQRGGEVR